MEYVAVLIVAALLFGACYLIHRAFEKVLRNPRDNRGFYDLHKSCRVSPVEG